MDKLELPELDVVALKEKAKEAAMKGAMKEIEEFYTGYDSPYRKMIKEHLKKQEIHGIIDLPDIIGTINQSMSNEILKIANTAVAQSFVPMLKNFLQLENKEMKFSEFLKHFIEETDQKDIEDCSVSTEKHEKYDWVNVEIRGETCSYEFTLHKVSAINAEEKEKLKDKYHLLSLPHGVYRKDDNHYLKKMKLSVGDGELELPFLPDILSDTFLSFLARCVISGTHITFDTREFDDSMFPEKCHC